MMYTYRADRNGTSRTDIVDPKLTKCRCSLWRKHTYVGEAEETVFEHAYKEHVDNKNVLF